MDGFAESEKNPNLNPVSDSSNRIRRVDAGVFAAISSAVTLILHVVSTDGERRSTAGEPWGGGGVTYGPGFMLVVAAMACFVAAAASLCLDDTVRAVTKALYHCQRRRAPATGQSSHVPAVLLGANISCHRVSDCLSVRLSQVGVLLKRLNVGSRKQRRTIDQGL